MNKYLWTWVAALALSACGGKTKTEDTTAAGATANDTRSLYERLGGKDAIAAVVKEFVATTGADPRISMFFTNADIPRLEQLMVEQICEATGGPCKYTGKTMKVSHTGMKVGSDHFEAFIEDLTKTLEKFQLAEREKSEVLAAFRSMQGDVVE
ncbi:MAG: group I truncated hemoglobin [Kofleriaceae bacterium]